MKKLKAKIEVTREETTSKLSRSYGEDYSLYLQMIEDGEAFLTQKGTVVFYKASFVVDQDIHSFDEYLKYSYHAEGVTPANAINALEYILQSENVEMI